MGKYSWPLSEVDKRVAELKEEYYSLTEKTKLLELRNQYDKSYSQETFSDKPKVFIYTPTYNRSAILKNCALKSVLSQTYDNFEYLIVGDGCTDNTQEIAENCGDSRVHYLSVPQRSWRYPPSAENHWLAGPVEAANTALKFANGRWIARLDDDDEWVPDHLEYSLKFAVLNNYEFVSGLAREWRDGIENVSSSQPLYGEYFRISKPTGGGGGLIQQ